MGKIGEALITLGITGTRNPKKINVLFLSTRDNILDLLQVYQNYDYIVPPFREDDIHWSTKVRVHVTNQILSAHSKVKYPLTNERCSLETQVTIAVVGQNRHDRSELIKRSENAVLYWPSFGGRVHEAQAMSWVGHKFQSPALVRFRNEPEEEWPFHYYEVVDE